MKFRNGFVSNSSSSSFVIQMKDLSGSDIEAIMNHIEYARIHGDIDFGYVCDEDAWTVYIEDGELHGSVFMDNFSMYTLFEHLGISDKVKWRD